MGEGHKGAAEQQAGAVRLRRLLSLSVRPTAKGPARYRDSPSASSIRDREMDKTNRARVELMTGRFAASAPKVCTPATLTDSNRV